MQPWTLLSKQVQELPQDRPFIVYWRQNICLIQYSRDIHRFLCSAFPALHMQMIELHPRELYDITHWMELPKAPANHARQTTSKMTKPQDDRQVAQKKGRKPSEKTFHGLQT